MAYALEYVENGNYKGEKMAFKRIEDSDLKGKGNVGRPDTPGVDTAEMQRILDEIPREIIVPAFNALVDALNEGTGADGITVTVPSGVPEGTASNLNAVLAALGAELLKRVISDDVKKIRLNSFGELEVSTDGSEFTVASSRGHVIEDGLDNTYTQRRMFDGDPLTEEATESIRNAMAMALEYAKKVNKEKYTPKKYRKEKGE